MPSWFKNNEGQGVVLTSNRTKQKFIVNIVKDGKLKLIFHAPKIVNNGKKYPLWIDYKSIKIDGKEILSKPAITWHDEYFKYEFIVKNGCEITVEYEQQYHQYSKNELKELVTNLNHNNEYVNEHTDYVVAKLLEKLSVNSSENKDSAA